MQNTIVRNTYIIDPLITSFTAFPEVKVAENLLIRQLDCSRACSNSFICTVKLETPVKNVILLNLLMIID